MKFLIFGCNGMAGHTISLYLKEHGHAVTGFARQPSDLIPVVTGNAHDLDFINKIVQSRGGGRQYDVIVNCVGILNQFAEEQPAEAVFLNAYFPHFLAKTATEIGTRLIHISTDCVFSGQRGTYREEDFRDGVTFYDRTKALGEVEYGNALTLRMSIVGPDRNPNGIGLLNWFMQREGEIDGYTKTIWTGQTTLQLAKTIEEAAEKNVGGLCNAVPDASISKYELLRLFNRYLRNDELDIHPTDGVDADKSLVRTRLREELTPIPRYEQMIAELAQWMLEHQSLYPHYRL